MIFNSLTFWTLVVGLIAFVARWYFPTFPFDEITILSAVLFILGLFGVYPQFRAQGALTANIINSLAFWQLVAGLAAFVLHFFAPSFPFDQAVILAFILFLLGWFGIQPELRVRGLIK
jgi:NADH:ubiquinone oxidoreductase subunit K